MANAEPFIACTMPFVFSVSQHTFGTNVKNSHPRILAWSLCASLHPLPPPTFSTPNSSRSSTTPCPTVLSSRRISKLNWFPPAGLQTNQPHAGISDRKTAGLCSSTCQTYRWAAIDAAGHCTAELSLSTVKIKNIMHPDKSRWLSDMSVEFASLRVKLRFV